MRSVVFACALVLVGSMAGRSRGQQEDVGDAELRRLIGQLSERLEALERQHQADKERIGELEARLGELEGAARRPGGQPDTEALPEQRVEPAERRPLDLSSAYGAGNALNPQITVFMDTGGSISSRGSNKALNRFNLREVEVDMRAAISPTADGVLIVALGEEIESERSGDVEIEREVDVEEGYIHFHTLPYDLALKIGKFRNVFGRNNLLHTHDLPQVTRPLAVTNFLGAEGLATVGASLSWLVPNPWDKYLETTVEVVNSDGGAESPILGGPNADNPAVLAHVKFFDEIDETTTFELGGTYLFGKTSSDPDFDANVFGLDLAYRWVDPDPSKSRSVVLQGEVFWSHNDVEALPFRPGRQDALGAYAFAQYQLDKNWYLGLRGDYSEFPNSGSRVVDDYDVAVSPYITWYLTEFLRARLEYQHRLFDRRGKTGSEEAVFLQFTGVFGSHPPHPYWVYP